MKSWVVTMGFVSFWMSSVLRRSSTKQQYRQCHAWTTAGILTRQRQSSYSKDFLRPVSNLIGRNDQGFRLYHSTQNHLFKLKNFSEYATHVEVTETDAAITVETAILRSMRAYEYSTADAIGEYHVEEQTTNTNPDPHTDVVIVDEDGHKIGSDIDEWSLAAKQIGIELENHPQNQPMTPRQLLYLGSIWYLPAEDYRKNQELEKQQFPGGNTTNTNTIENHTKGMNYMKLHNRVKPIRLSLSNTTMVLREGDYLRIHHTPRRFPMVYKNDWSFPKRSNSGTSQELSTKPLPMVVRQQGEGYCIIDKPPLIPVHSTIDNSAENVAHQLLVALRDQQNEFKNATLDEEEEPYLAPVQRIDVNTSGLLVLATSPEFAAYFSQLLRRKTAAILNATTTTTSRSPSIQKGYKCLVCIQPGTGESVIEAWQRLSNLQRPKNPPNVETTTTNINLDNNRTNHSHIIRHYLKASDRAPKLFVDQIPNEDEDEKDSKWYECLLEITKVGDPIPLFATSGEESSRGGLWPQTRDGSSRMPLNAKAVVEVKVSLITGRTHQIRGQLSKLGFPIVGDEQYGGADPLLGEEETAPQLLALQCCHIGFPDVEYESVFHKKKRRDVLKGRPSRDDKWVQESLEQAWWTQYLEEHTAAAASGGFSDVDFEESNEEKPFVVESDQTAPPVDTIRPDLLPPSVRLSPGRNKYVIAKLRDPSTENLRWFVHSAPRPYHADVASELLEWISAVPGFETVRVEVMGGGRIWHDSESSKVSVYGFSYRYGKGDHVRAAQLIEESGEYNDVAYDLSDNLY